MTLDDLYLSHDSAISLEKLRIAEFGSIECYAEALAFAASKNFQRRCSETLRAISAWRTVRRYPDVIRDGMLLRLQIILNQSRASAVASSDLSKVAVTAAPVKIA
jgi:hypothetical protein